MPYIHRHPSIPVRPLALVALLAFAGCAAPSGGDRSDGSHRPFRSAGPVATLAPSVGAPTTGEVPAELLGEILADAIDRAGVPESEITIARAEQTTWPDGALGCPEPGQVYTQALVDGYQVVLEAGGERFDYRATSSGSFRLCEGGGRPAG